MDTPGAHGGPHASKAGRAWRVAAGLACILATPLRPLAQEPDSVRAFVGGDLLLASPTGEFAENVSRGIGIEGHAGVFVTPGDEIALRANLGFINYGNETIKICVTQPCRVTGELTTSNNIFFGGIGPEAGLNSGALRLYGNATVGFAYFATTSSAEGSHNQGDPFASSTNFDDLTFAWTSGGGAQLLVYDGPNPVRVNLGLRYHGNGEARYLRKGDIQDLPDGSVALNPRRSDTNLVTFHLGVSVELGLDKAEGSP